MAAAFPPVDEPGGNRAGRRRPRRPLPIDRQRWCESTNSGSGPDADRAADCRAWLSEGIQLGECSRFEGLTLADVPMLEHWDADGQTPLYEAVAWLVPGRTSRRVESGVRVARALAEAGADPFGRQGFSVVDDATSTAGYRFPKGPEPTTPAWEEAKRRARETRRAPYRTARTPWLLAVAVLESSIFDAYRRFTSAWAQMTPSFRRTLATTGWHLHDLVVNDEVKAKRKVLRGDHDFRRALDVAEAAYKGWQVFRPERLRIIELFTAFVDAAEMLGGGACETRFWTLRDVLEAPPVHPDAPALLARIRRLERGW